jgi:RNA polymerase sigma-70 factor (ECF subfamily)
MSIANQNLSWEELAQQAQAGDKRAYTILLKDLTPFIKAVVMNRITNLEWVDDITQTVLMSVHKSFNTYSCERPFKPWLTSIIYFRVADYLRKYYRSKDDVTVGTDDYDFQKTYVTNPDHQGELKDVEKLLDQLSEKQRKIYLMMKVEGFTAKEVAEQMNMSVSAVKVSAHRTGAKLRKESER